MPEWIDTSKELPQGQDITDECNDFHVVKLKNYGYKVAMFMGGNWFSDYASLIVKPVTHWLKE